MPLPDLFLDRLSRIVGPDDLPGVLATFEAPLQTSFRVCTLHAPETDVLARLAAEGVAFEAVPGVPGAFSVAPDHRSALLGSAVAAEGLVYAQNASSQSRCSWMMAATPVSLARSRVRSQRSASSRVGTLREVW